MGREHYKVLEFPIETAQEEIERRTNKMHEDGYRLLHVVPNGAQPTIFVFENIATNIFPGKIWPVYEPELPKIITSKWVPKDKVYLINPDAKFSFDLETLDVNKVADQSKIWGFDLGSSGAWSKPTSQKEIDNAWLAEEYVKPKTIKIPALEFRVPTREKKPLNQYGYTKQDRIPKLDERVIINVDDILYYGVVIKLDGNWIKVQLSNGACVGVYPSNIVGIRN